MRLFSDSCPWMSRKRKRKKDYTEEIRRVRAGGRGGDEDISEEEDMSVRNADEGSERGPEAGVRRQRRLQLDHMVCSSSPHIFHHSRTI